MTNVKNTVNPVHQKRMKKQEAREALPEELRETFDKLCEETLYWSQYYYGTTFILIDH